VRRFAGMTAGIHALRLLAASHGSAWSPACPRIRACPLTSRWHATPMSQTAVAPDVHQALDIHRNFSAQIAHLLVNDLTDAVDLVIGQITHSRIRADIRSLE
jgi:hypothetical protein